MMWVVESGVENGSALASSDIQHVAGCVSCVEYAALPRADVTLDEDELSNVIEFIETNFIESIRTDTDIDNIDYIISMMSALQKFRLAYASIKLEEETSTINQEESK